jgi:hypothetical protein
VKKNKFDIILDFETIGTDTNKCFVLDVSFAVFNWDRFLTDPYTFKNKPELKRFKFDLLDQKQYGFIHKKSDLDFWLGQSEVVRNKIKPSKDDITILQFCTDMLKWLSEQPKISHWWSRSNTFDPMILWRILQTQNKQQEFDSLCPFFMVRDTRTWIDAKFNFATKNGFCPVTNEDEWNKQFEAHSSDHDIIADIMRLQSIARAEADMEQITL